MADEAHEIHGINWREAFGFTHIFRSFRVAIHPSKLILAMMALVLLYVGGRILDWGWVSRHRAVPGEIAMYENFRHDTPGDSFRDVRRELHRGIEDTYAKLLVAYAVIPDRDEALKAAQKPDSAQLDQLRQAIVDRREKARTAAQAAHDRTIGQPGSSDPRLEEDARKALQTSIAGAYSIAARDWRAALGIKNRGIFAELFDFEVNQVNGVVHGVISDNWLGPQGVTRSVLNFFTVGPVWLMTQHPAYFILFTVWFLIVWSIFGGAIARIAAVHVARDEKLSFWAALKFSSGKFLSFISAPVIPMVIVLLIGLLPIIGGLLSSIPFAGPVFMILMGLLFLLILTAGFVMALVLLGTAGGFNLMYPTIAVEGSDSFDAISRSFSYVYARPWRLLFYTAVAVVYGALTFLFVQMFIWLMLTLANHFVGYGMHVTSPAQTPLWSTIWPSPDQTGRLSYSIDYISLRGDQKAAAILIACWVYLCISLLGAYAISYYFSANTIIYYLMRNEVDATEMDDVYLEQMEEEFHEPAPAAPEPTPAQSTPAVAATATPVATDPASPATTS